MLTTSHLRVTALCGLFLGPTLLGCAETQDESGTRESPVATSNGLRSINGLSTSNGLGSNNGLFAINGLRSINGLSTSNGLMTTSDGRTTVEYLVRCALAAGTTLVKQDQYAKSYTFNGELGLAPQWADSACDTNCQEIVSACMMAHINTAGVHIPLWVVAQNPAVGWGLDPGYPNQEGSFFGNIFGLGCHGTDQSKVAAFYCNGRAYDKDVVPGRIGANQNNAPYTDPFTQGGLYQNYPGASGTGFCADYCTASDYPYGSSGYKACGGWNNVITTYRQAATGGTISATTTSGPSLTATITKYFDSPVGYCANVNVSNNSSAPVPSWTVVYDIGAAIESYNWWTVSDSAVGSVHTAKGSGAIATIPAAGTFSFGYCASYKTTAVSPVVKSVSAS
jgi:hypothetical protein